MKYRTLVLMLVVVAAPRAVAGLGDPPFRSGRAGQTKHVLLVTTDGLRWQEVFRGADPALVQLGNVAPHEMASIKDEFLAAEPVDRRKALLPFVWNVIAREGQLFGNADAGSEVKVTNGRNSSYPGYNEIITGMADPAIGSNAKVPNGNVTVLEWLNRQDEFTTRIAAFGSWDVFPYILNRGRSKLRVVAGWEQSTSGGLSESERLITKLVGEMPRIWPNCCFDALTFHSAHEYFKRQRPRVLYLGLGETDEFAHQGRYDHYLRAARRVDRYLQALWETVQALPDYRGKTTLIVTTDHGRGSAPVEWKSHGTAISGSDKVWIGVLGPDTAALGARTNVEALTQSQVAATLAALLGYDYRHFAPRAGAPISSVLPGSETRDAADRKRTGR